MKPIILKPIILKPISILLLLVLSVSFAGCGDKENPKNQSENDTTTSDGVHSDGGQSDGEQPRQPYAIPHDVTTLNVEVDYPQDLLVLEHTWNSCINMEEYEKKNLNMPVNGHSMKTIGDKIIVENYVEGNIKIEQLGIFDPYNNSYKKIADIPFSVAYGNYSFVMDERYFVMIYSFEGEKGLNGGVIIYDIETDALNTIDEFAEYNIVNGVTPVGENGIAYFYYEDITQDWVVKYYDFSTKESSEIFRNTNFNKNSTSSMMGIGSAGSDIVLTVQYIENGIYQTNLEWVTKSGDWHKTEHINLGGLLYGNEYEVKSIVVSEDYYFVNALIIPVGESYCNILKRNGDEINMFSFNTYFPTELLSESFKDKSNLVYDSPGYSYITDIATRIIDGIVVVNLPERKMKSFKFVEGVSLNGNVLLVNDDLFIFNYDDKNEKLSNYQLIEDFKSINTSPYLNDIPQFPFEPAHRDVVTSDNF
ncbi:hypothetical protein FACS1894132_02700 [Clostridia bacterium]|nr:hypothetical protein FACS1894132_02700 [Clostridia bacterium]